MHSADEVIRAAKIISSALPTLTEELLSTHRRELQFAFDRLEHVLRSEISISNATQEQNSSQSPHMLPMEPCFGPSINGDSHNAFEYIRSEGSRHLNKQPVQEQPMSEQSMPEQPMPEQPMPEQPMPEPPTQEQPQEQPTSEQPMLEQPTQEQPQEQPMPEQLQEQPMPEQLQERPMLEQPQEQPMPEQPQEQPIQEQPQEQPMTEQPQEQLTQEQPQEQPMPEQPTQEQTAQEIQVSDGLPRQPAGRKGLTQEDYLSTMMKMLEKDVKKIKSFSNKSEAHAVLYGENWSHMDPLEVDIQLSLRGCSLAQKFRAILARYIFAQKYLDWAETTYELPRVSFLLLDAKGADSKRKDSYIRNYLGAIDRSSTGNQRSVQIGVKMHSFEHIYGKIGTFSFLFYVYSYFRGLKYSSLKCLADLIRDSPIWSELAETSEGWFKNCVLLYKKDCAEYRNQRGQKRPIDSDGLEESQNKRTELDFGTLMSQTDNANVEDDARIGLNASIPPYADLNSIFLDENGVLRGFDPFVSDFGFLESLNGLENFQLIEAGPEANFSSQDNGVGVPLSISETVC
ncbi:hypothetical protein N7466_001439 [Penicillium verhagenii]|uniref:uncharacterized protein n=1 Tax=Penicillium verhagenii TaxID=1562060 RepID=UPI002544F788|nr:uncharacterized protein N7466_001439 [Penicillium verhagenii]KAJ5938305.1 hypothetical protein N7466_001439 [Penicillium verhagenii]